MDDGSSGGAPDDAAAARPELTNEIRDANSMIASGIGIGVVGAAVAAISGAVCPVCIVAVPALVGAGAYKRWRAKRQR